MKIVQSANSGMATAYRLFTGSRFIQEVCNQAAEQVARRPWNKIYREVPNQVADRSVLEIRMAVSGAISKDEDRI